MGKNSRITALFTGIVILLMAVAAGFSYGYVFGNLVNMGDASLTADNIIKSLPLFKEGVFGFLVILILDVFAAWGLYIYFADTHKNISLLSSLMRLGYVLFLGIAISYLVSVINIADMGISKEELFLNIRGFSEIWGLGLIIFGLHLLLTGYLAIKSKKVPKIIAILLVIAGICYIVTNTFDFLFTAYDVYKTNINMFTAPIMAAGELIFALWLSLKGGK